MTLQNNEEKILTLKAELNRLQKSILRLQFKKNQSINDFSKIQTLHDKIDNVELNIEVLSRNNSEECQHQWEYLGNSIYKQCSQCELKAPKNS